MQRNFIPNSAPWITQREIDAVTECLKSGRIASNEENLLPAKLALQQLLRGKDVLLTTSCTLALELALSCLKLEKGDEVIMPSYTFVSCANAVLQCGGTPVFVDIEDDTLNLNLEEVHQKITNRTRVIMPVHYAGISCDMDTLIALVKKRGIDIIEDAAHAIGAKYKGLPLGTLGTFGCFSFHDTKNYVCGEGGAFVINDPQWKEQAEWIYEKGTNRSSFLRGEIDKYTWVAQGSSYALSAILASLLHVQLERYEEIQQQRTRIVEQYRTGLEKLEQEGYIRFPSVPEYATPSHHLCFFLLNDPSIRDSFLSYMKAWGIGATFHYIPLHLSPFAHRELHTTPGELPVTEHAASSIVRLPLFPHLPLSDCDYIIETIFKFFSGGKIIHAPSQTSYVEKNADAETVTFDLSLILPCYNEAPHLHESLNEILDVLDRTSLKYEVLLIDDCSQDETPKLIEEYLTLHPHHHLRSIYHTKNKGRGATVSEGITFSRGRYVGFIDVDLEVHARYIPAAILPLQRAEADMVIADRSYRMHPLFFHRILMTAGYKWLVRWLLKTPAIDTEAGFKFFRREAIMPILEQTKDPHWFWDTEISVRSYDNGLIIHSIPVLFEKRKNKKSTVKFVQDSWKSLMHLLKFCGERRREERAHSIGLSA